MILIGGKSYELLKDHKNGWNPEAFRDRYSEVLDRYDYIIGDWGYNQLRLKGFFRDKHPKSNKDSAYSGMLDYINEYCNFGCAYFVLQKNRDGQPKEKEKQEKPEKLDQPERVEKPEKQEKQPEKQDRPEKSGKMEKQDKPEKVKNGSQ
ncbi:YutD family protein [Paenibacillus sp. KQZ6P-2]|uniref:YutD family protein n=1 Tax=Paenibacillus mangrovi TaxID=2931978 RepID=A0A9X1WUW4_9BACL|nr:YutD family protein [Paenibacillus mangrovi]MCJ8014350.1 YutD family protein [Paenibacillus mangrovi]